MSSGLFCGRGLPLLLCESVYKSLHRQGRSNLLANFLPLSRRGKLKTRFLTRRRVRYGSVETGAHCAPLQVGVNIAHRGILLIHRFRGPSRTLQSKFVAVRLADGFLRWGRQTERCAITCHMKVTFLHPPRDPTAKGGRPSGFGTLVSCSRLRMTRGRCAKGLCSEYGAKLQAKRSGIYETQSVILSVTREDAKQKRESHFQVRGAEVLRSEYGAKPQGAAVAGSTK